MSKFKNIILSFVAVLLFPVFISDNTLGFSNTPFSILVWVGLYWMLCRTQKIVVDRRTKVCSGMFGTLLAFFTAAGYSLDNQGGLQYKNIFLIAGVIIYSYICTKGIQLFWNWLKVAEKYFSKSIFNGWILHKTEHMIETVFSRPVVVAIILFLCWVPCYLAEFPGGFRYDATNEFNQLINGYQGDFPMLHSALITKIMGGMYQLTGSYNAGIAIYTISQMFFMSFMCTHILVTFFKRGINRFLLGCTFLYCAVFPVIQMLASQEVRDVLFSALLTYTIFWFYLMCTDKSEFMKTKHRPLILGFLVVLTIFARNNNAGIVMLCILIAACGCILIRNRKEYLRGALIFTGASTLGYIAIGALLTALCQPMSSASPNASMSLISQPIVRTYVKKGELWSEQERKEFSNYVNLDGMRYAPRNADPTKASLMLNRKNILGFVKFWFKMGIRYPDIYMDAVLENTEYMWFPGSVIDGYQSCNVEQYKEYEKCYYAYTETIAEPGTLQNLLPDVHKFYEKIGLFVSFEKIPVVSMMFSIGFQFWIILNCMFYCISRRQTGLYLPSAIILGYMLISAFVPLILLRYFAAAFLAMPLIIIFTLQPTKACTSSV